MRPIVMLAAAALAAVQSRPAAAQSGGDVAAYFALHSTPLGALPPVAPMAAGAARGTMLRYGRLPIGDGATLQTVALRFDRSTGAGRLGWTVGTQLCDGCSNLVMTGVDYIRPLVGSRATSPRSARLQAALAPSLGLAIPLESLGSTWIVSAGVGVPVSVSVPVGATARLVPFLTPGLGVGILAGGGGGEVGARPFVGGGAELTGIGGGVGVSAGFQKLFVRNAEVQVGAALTWRPAGVPR